MARQNAGLYFSTENNTVISILINDCDKARISFLLKRHEETTISSLYANKSIYNSNTYRKPTERYLRNPVEFMEAYYTFIKEIEKLKDLLALSMEFYHLITKILLFKDLIFGIFCCLLELNGTEKKVISSLMAKRFSYSNEHLYCLCLSCAWVV